MQQTLERRATANVRMGEERSGTEIRFLGKKPKGDKKFQWGTTFDCGRKKLNVTKSILEGVENSGEGMTDQRKRGIHGKNNELAVEPSG